MDKNKPFTCIICGKGETDTALFCRTTEPQMDKENGKNMTWVCEEHVSQTDIHIPSDLRRMLNDILEYEKKTGIRIL